MAGPGIRHPIEESALRRLAVVLVFAACMTSAVALAATAAWAQEGGEGLQTTLTHDGEPVPGVTITVYTEDGALVGSAATDEDGYWTVPVPESATYRVELVESTLPEGLSVVGGNVREPFVRPGSVGGLLFGLTTGSAPEQPQPPPPDGESPAEPAPDGEVPPEEQIP